MYEVRRRSSSVVVGRIKDVRDLGTGVQDNIYIHIYIEVYIQIYIHVDIQVYIHVYIYKSYASNMQ